MATKFQNPPVVYTAAKLIFAESIGSYSDEKYKSLLTALESHSFDSYTVSKLMGVQLKQSDNQFTAIPTNAERVGYFSENRRRCAVIDENTIELRLSEYDNHTRFLDEFKSLIDICFTRGIAIGNKLREIELHYVDLFVPQNCQLKDMFASSVTMPMDQFYSDENDALKVGATSFTRVLASGTSRVSINLEQLKVLDAQRRKYLPDSLVELDSKLSMPLDVERLFTSKLQNEYAIVHTACGSLIDMDSVDTAKIREMLELLYIESRKTFDHMLAPKICDGIWEVEAK
ncbi:hypothetical protein C9I43_01375 [Shewanella morhuae]|uniref:TIGR04255 family protein n=1 Tax=Shewanella morhuae TaxID=365591 RepID=A0ABX5HR00_9GAMM|nr:hypothetical protein [Shewanella morhuae]PTA49271.1 hypothetical protein C9I43_01375 [Shewanella morhuae]